MEASLKNLREHCKTVKEKFRGLLEVEYMDVLVVDNPFRLEPHEEDKINLREMIMRYQAVLFPLILHCCRIFFPKLFSMATDIYAAV